MNSQTQPPKNLWRNGRPVFSSGKMTCLALIWFMGMTGGCGKSSQAKFEDITKKSHLVYLKDSPQPFSGKAVLFHKNGKKKFEAAYVNGVEEGLYTLWYENGRVMHQATYRKGHYEGVSTWWDDAGNPASRVIYQGGKEVSREVKKALDITPDAIPVFRDGRR